MSKKKKKIKKTKKAKKAVKATKAKKIKKISKPKKIKKTVKKVLAKKKSAPKIKEKLLGKIEHYFDKIAVAAISVKAPFKVGDTIHIKGHTTDFTQKVESMQIEHDSVTKVKKGDDVGIKVKDYVRDHDLVYLAPEEKAVVAKPAVIAKKAEPIIRSKPAAPKSQFIQTSIFEAGKSIQLPAPKPAAAPQVKPAPDIPKPKVEPKKEGDNNPYQEKKFFSF